MKLKNFTKRKGLAFGLAFGVAAGAGGIAAAFFHATGSGTGTATVGHSAHLTINQIGAGYDSLINAAGNPYTSSQCFVACAGFTQIGNKVTLAYLTPKWAAQHFAHLTSVTVPLVNFTTAKAVTVTLNLTPGPNGHYTFHRSVNLPTGSLTNQVVTDVTFTLANTAVFEGKTFVYGVEVSNTAGVNIAMVHPSQVTVGSSPTNTVYIQHGVGTFQAEPPGATTTGYIPAVQINVIGGIVPPMYPGEPAQAVQYAITNPTTGNLHVGTITTSLKTAGASTATIVTALNCKAAWFQLANPTYSYPHNVGPGTTIITSSTTIQMITSGTQDACIGHTVPLAFSSH